MVTLKIIGNLEVNTARLTEKELADIRQAQYYQERAYMIVHDVLFSDSFRKNNAKPGEWCSGNTAVSQFVHNLENIKKEIIYDD